MISHHQAYRLLATVEGDDAAIAALKSYIETQQRGPKDCETLTQAEHLIRASNRAAEAISRLGACQSALSDAERRIVALEAAMDDQAALLIKLWDMLSQRATATLNQ